jgi:hypothetical protein
MFLARPVGQRNTVAEYVCGRRAGERYNRKEKIKDKNNWETTMYILFLISGFPVLCIHYLMAYPQVSRRREDQIW